MALVIKHSIEIFLVNPDDSLYKSGHKKKELKKFFSSLKQPYSLRTIQVKNLNKIDIKYLAPISKDFNLVIIPVRYFYFDLKVVSGHIILFISLSAGNPNYCHGIYHQSLSLVSKYLSGTPVEIGKGSLFRKLKPEGKAIIIASMVDIKDPNYFKLLRLKIFKIKLDKKLRSNIIKTLNIKRKLYKLYKED